jgi:hypothetical protein
MPTFDQLFNKILDTMQDLRSDASKHNVSMEQVMEHEHNTRLVSHIKLGAEQFLADLESLRAKSKIS